MAKHTPAPPPKKTTEATPEQVGRMDADDSLARFARGIAAGARLELKMKTLEEKDRRFLTAKAERAEYLERRLLGIPA
jgi:hypothetical protein